MEKEQVLNRVNSDINEAKVIIEAYRTEKYDGVRVKALGEDFVITLHDIDDEKDDFKHNEAMDRLKELGLTTFNKRQAILICLLLDQINNKLVEAGGKPFARDWYVTSELYGHEGMHTRPAYYAPAAWLFNGEIGYVTYHSRFNPNYRVRPAFALPTRP